MSEDILSSDYDEWVGDPEIDRVSLVQRALAAYSAVRTPSMSWCTCVCDGCMRRHGFLRGDLHCHEGRCHVN